MRCSAAGRTKSGDKNAFFAQSFEGLLEMLPKWRSTHIFREIVPKLKAAGLSQAQIDTILIDNPKRLFARGLGGGCC